MDYFILPAPSADDELASASAFALALSGNGDAVATADHAKPLLDRGQVVLDKALLRRLRQSRLLSQQDLADDCWRRNIRVSIATIKRAESGRAVRFRIAHELARCFDVPVMRIVRTPPAA
ncbi:helix-turn-helix domain-containing protein [Lysobacter sp. CA196]|uniref:helix-turn-helix domain-containing protein n=1 Tax=Lysobacter sp. CA196 TaxID=3455606 RepID=UPI003F8D65B0